MCLATEPISDTVSSLNGVPFSKFAIPKLFLYTILPFSRRLMDNPGCFVWSISLKYALSLATILSCWQIPQVERVNKENIKIGFMRNNLFFHLISHIKL